MFFIFLVPETVCNPDWGIQFLAKKQLQTKRFFSFCRALALAIFHVMKIRMGPIAIAKKNYQIDVGPANRSCCLAKMVWKPGNLTGINTDDAQKCFA